MNCDRRKMLVDACGDSWPPKMIDEESLNPDMAVFRPSNSSSQALDESLSLPPLQRIWTTPSVGWWTTLASKKSHAEDWIEFAVCPRTAHFSGHRPPGSMPTKGIMLLKSINWPLCCIFSPRLTVEPLI